MFDSLLWLAVRRLILLAVLIAYVAIAYKDHVVIPEDRIGTLWIVEDYSDCDEPHWWVCAND